MRPVASPADWPVGYQPHADQQVRWQHRYKSTQMGGIATVGALAYAGSSVTAPARVLRPTPCLKTLNCALTTSRRLGVFPPKNDPAAQETLGLTSSRNHSRGTSGRPARCPGKSGNFSTIESLGWTPKFRHSWWRRSAGRLTWMPSSTAPTAPRSRLRSALPHGLPSMWIPPREILSCHARGTPEPAPGVGNGM